MKTLSQVLYITFFASIFVLSAQAQHITSEQQKLIAASQTGASPLHFNPDHYSWPVVQPSKFNHPEEFITRKGLPNFFKKCTSEEKVSIAYIGGSITRADNQYRIQSAKFIRSLFPNTEFLGLNAGISGTGSDLGACRLYEQVLQFNPDLVFIEFAVNGAFAEGVEGIIRQIWKHDPHIDICLIYTITDRLSNIYSQGGIPNHIANLDLLAEYYSIPSIHLGMEAAFLEKEEKLMWKGNRDELNSKIIFSADGVHPMEAGGNLYAEAIARAMLKMKNKQALRTHDLPKPFFVDNWEDAHMVDPASFATFNGQWDKIDPASSEGLNQFSGWFPYLLKTENSGASFSFQFEGNMFGLFDIGGPEVGQLEVELDGRRLSMKKLNDVNYVASTDTSAIHLINRFNRYCNNRYRGQCFFVKVLDGKHRVKISVSDQQADKIRILGSEQLTDISGHPEKYSTTVEYIGKILFRGEIIK